MADEPERLFGGYVIFTEKSSDVCRVSCQLHVLCVFDVLKGGKTL